jgi:hypothetical protein
VGYSLFVCGYTSTSVTVATVSTLVFYNPPFGTGGTINLHMKPKTTSEGPSSKRLLLYVLGTMILTVAFFAVINSTTVKRSFMSQAQKIEDTASVKSLPVNDDSIQLINKKVPASTFESVYSAPSWYADYKANKVAFDKNYNEQTIDIHGVIDKINNNDNCAEIIIRGDEGAFEWIKFTNCSEGKDGWTDEVINTAVGQEVHIRGKYSNLLSDNYEMVLYKCHIISNN